VLGVLAVGAFFASLWIEHRSDIELPAPTGPFAVGREIGDWFPGTKRELLVWIWYPAAAGPSSAVDDYVPARMLAAAGPSRGPLALLTRDLSKVHGHSLRNAALSPRQRSYATGRAKKRSSECLRRRTAPSPPQSSVWDPPEERREARDRSVGKT
jgi:hypothetical protein